jgi:hypothetical protein
MRGNVMSAFIVDHDHIDALISFMHHFRHELISQTTLQRLGVEFDPNELHETIIGRILLAENEKSVLHRYPGDTLDNAPGKIGERSTNYNFREFYPALTPVQAIKACHCLEYQSCEHDGWQQSPAFRILQAIERAAIRMLPGYEEAPWGIPSRIEDRRSRNALDDFNYVGSRHHY